MNKENEKTRNIMMSGFTLLEVIISISISTIILGALGLFIFENKIKVEKGIERSQRYLSKVERGFVLITVVVSTSILLLLLTAYVSQIQSVNFNDSYEDCFQIEKEKMLTCAKDAEMSIIFGVSRDSYCTSTQIILKNNGALGYGYEIYSTSSSQICFARSSIIGMLDKEKIKISSRIEK